MLATASVRAKDPQVKGCGARTTFGLWHSNQGHHISCKTTDNNFRTGTRQLVGLSSAPTAAGEVQLGSRAPGLRMSWLRHKSFKKHSRPHLQVYDSRQLQPQATAADVHSALHLQPPNNTWAPATPMPDSAVVPLQEGMLAAAVVHPAASTEAAKLFGIVHQWWLPQPGLTSALNSSKPLQAGCGPLTVEKVAAAAVNYTVMLMLSDYSTPPDLLHHWLGNVEAANIGYYLIASTDDATDEHLTAHGVSSRCYRLAETQHRSTSEGELKLLDCVTNMGSVVIMGFGVLDVLMLVIG